MALLLVFCEARADFETTAGLVERVLREEAPAWVRDLLDAGPEAASAVLAWHPDKEQHESPPFFDLHHAKDLASRLRVRIPHGHFDGEPGKPGALMARTAFLVARELARRGTPIDAVLLVWDMDDQGEDRRRGVKQGRAAVASIVPFKIVLGCPDPMREAWVLAGFDPETDDERASLAAERQRLGFCPSEEAKQLTAKDEQATHNPKRVLHELTAGDRDREARCWTAAPLETLRARGQASGLTAFLDEVAATVIPLVTNAPRPS